jgi:hypothetical protein
MKQVTSKLIRIFSLIFLFAFFVDTADAQRRQRGERQTKERQGRTREKSKRSDTETVEVADEIPEFQQAVEDGSIPELKRSESKGASGRRRAGRRSARVAGAGKAEGTEVLDNFLVHPNQYIAKWHESRGESRWMRGTPSDCAAECLKEENQWCDAFFAYNWGGQDYCILTDDVDPMESYVSEGLTLASYTYFDKATADRAASVDEMVRTIAQKDAEIEALNRDVESLRQQRDNYRLELWAVEQYDEDMSTEQSQEDWGWGEWSDVVTETRWGGVRTKMLRIKGCRSALLIADDHFFLVNEALIEDLMNSTPRWSGYHNNNGLLQYCVNTIDRNWEGREGRTLVTNVTPFYDEEYCTGYLCVPEIAEFFGRDLNDPSVSWNIPNLSGVPESIRTRENLDRGNQKIEWRVQVRHQH